MKAPLLLLFVALVLSAQNTSYALVNPTIINVGGDQPYSCQTQACATANAGAEVFYTAKVPGYLCDSVWSMSVTGASPTNLTGGATPVYSGLPPQSASPATTYSHGSARWNPAGTWFVVEAQSTSTSLPCTQAGAKVGVGLGYSLWLCRVSNKTCYLMAIEGDNNGNFCAAGVACPVLAALVSYVDDNHGVLHFHWTPDGTKIYGMYIMGHGTNSIQLNGTLRWATVTLPGSGAPTLSNVTETDVATPANGTLYWYEGAGALPANVEPSTCTIFASSFNNSAAALSNVGTLQYNICTGAYSFLTFTGSYGEWWEVRTQGDIGIGTTAHFLPATNPFNANGGVAGPLDLAYGPATPPLALNGFVAGRKCAVVNADGLMHTPHPSPRAGL